MYRIDFLLGQQKIAEFTTDWDDKDRALEVAREKAQFILSLLTQKPAVQEIEAADRPEDYVEGKLTPAARQRLIDERAVALWGPHEAKPKRTPVWMDVVHSVGVRLVSDTGQISLFDLNSKGKMVSKPEQDDWRPSGDYQAQILLSYAEQKLTIGTLEFAATTASRALSMATEQARTLIAQLKQAPGLGFLTFNAVTIHVTRVNTQLSMVDEEPDFDWTEMTYPAPRF